MEQEQQQPEKAQPEAAQFTWRSKEGTPQIYSNYVNVSWTLFDVRFILGQLIPEHPGTKEFVVEERASVTFAWPEAKAVRDMLVTLIEQYEKTNGEIKPPKLPPSPESLTKKETE
jgi:hypothetical protein